jgi:hypothetical protein
VELHRLGVKLFLRGPAAPDLELLVPVLHSFVQERVLEGTLIDVADYRHVREGPGVMLVAHEGDYSLDQEDGRPGLLYVRKRAMPGGLPEKLRVVLRSALLASRAIEAAPALRGKLRFDLSEAEVVVVDRLRAPNGRETWERLRPELETFARSVYAGHDPSVSYEEKDPRGLFRARIRASGAPAIDALLARVEAPAAR